MTKKIIFITLIILTIIISTLFFLNSKKLIIDYNNNIEISVNEEVYNLDNINNIENGKLITEKELIDTSKIGEIKVNFKVKTYFNKIKEYEYTINVIDKEKPIIEFKKEIETKEGKEIDLLKYVTVTDNSKEEIIPKVEGEYDINKPDEYKLYYIAEDSSHNKTTEEFTLIVKEKKKEEVPTINNNDTTFTTKKGFKGTTKNGVTYIDGYLIVNKTYSLPLNFGVSLTKETIDNFNKMKSAATLEGLNIYISSGFRSYDTQKKLYNNYVNRDGKEAADTYSARAGHSEHQSGLAFDVNTINDTFANTAEAKWLASNCYKYGFILRYPQGKSNETGYKYESWHFRYVGTELAEKLYNNGNWITLEDYFGITSEY